MTSADRPAPALPTDNEWGIPILDLAYQAQLVDAPWVRWGRERRKNRLHGTGHFYTDDYRFERVWQRPEDVINSGLTSVVEPNFSIHAQTPRAVALHQTFRKRYLARLWQLGFMGRSLYTFVDLNVPERHAELNMLGVPKGWRAYATRASATELGLLGLQYQRAQERAGATPLFVVYAGGRGAELWAQRTPGAVWFPEEATAVRQKRGPAIDMTVETRAA